MEEVKPGEKGVDAVNCKEKQMPRRVSVRSLRDGLNQYPHWVRSFARKRIKNVVSPREWGIETLSTGLSHGREYIDSSFIDKPGSKVAQKCQQPLVDDLKCFGSCGPRRSINLERRRLLR